MRFLFLAFAAVSLQAGPLTLFSDLGTGGSVYSTDPGSLVQGSGVGGNSISQARPFTVSGTGDFDVTQIDLGVVHDIGNTFTASIWTSASSQPGSSLGSWNLTADEPGGSCCLLATQTGITGVTLTGGSQYFMVLEPQKITDASKIEWEPNSLGQISTVFGSLNGGATWIQDGSSSNAAFDVLGTAAATATPEPASLLLVGMGMTILGAVRLRKRQNGR